MISGLVIFYNYRSREGFDSRKFFKKKLTYILIPYLIWSIFYFFYDIYLYNNPWTIGQLINKLLLGGAYSHLYFIFLIFQFYLLVPIFLRFLPENMEKRPWKVVGISFVCQLVVLVYGYYFKGMFSSNFMKVFDQIYWKTVFSWQFYFILGGTLGVHYKKVLNFIEKNIVKLFIVFILGTAFYVGQVYLDVLGSGNLDNYDKFGSIRPQTMVFAITTMPVLMYLSKIIVGKYKILENIGMYSFGIYFVHPLVLNEIRRKLFLRPDLFGYGRISSLILVTGLGVVLTYVLVALIGMTRGRKVLIGNIPRYEIEILKRKPIENK